MNQRPVDRVLYVEDESSIQTVGLFSLKEVGGLTVEPANSGIEALEKVQTFGPDVILLDVMMPGIDGIATFKALRAEKETTRVPIIFMTAKVQPNEVEDYLKLGAIGVIAKPFDPLTLADQIRRIWEAKPAGC